MVPPISYSYQVGKALAWTIFSSVGARIEGKEHIPASGSVLLVSNHQSYLDPLFVSLGCPKRQIHFMAKEELFDFPTSRHMMLGLGAFPVNRNGPGKATLIEVLKLLRDDRCLCLFAEGTLERRYSSRLSARVCQDCPKNEDQRHTDRDHRNAKTL